MDDVVIHLHEMFGGLGDIGPAMVSISICRSEWSIHGSPIVHISTICIVHECFSVMFSISGHSVGFLRIFCLCSRVPHVALGGLKSFGLGSRGSMNH